MKDTDRRDKRKRKWDKNFNIYSAFDKSKDSVHPAEIAEIIDEIPFDSAVKAFIKLPNDTKVKVFRYLDLQLQHKLMLELSREDTAHILNNLNSDDRTRFFTHVPVNERAKYFSTLNEKNKQVTQDFLGYPKNSVARIVDTNYATISKGMSVGEASKYVRENFKDSEAINVIYVVDEDGKLLDDIQVRRLVLNPPETMIADLMDGDYIALQMDDSKEKAVEVFMDYDRVVIPVVNEENYLMGVVTVDDIMDVAERQETKDMHKIGGVEELDFPYVKTNFFRLTEKRATWLVILFVGEMLTATAMGFFEDEISAAVVLALFVPLVISSGGNSGSQAATLIIRALALKEITLRDWWFVMRREILSGFALGVILGMIGFLRISVWHYLGWYDYGEYWYLIALTILLSLIGIVLWGTLSGAMIPIILKKLKLDPATSSAPFVATLVDVTGLIIYFTIAALVLKGTIL